MFGVYPIVPLEFISNVPFSGNIRILLTTTVFPSGSVSLISTGILIKTPGPALTKSSSARGASLIAFTVMLSVAFAVFSPSVIV